MSRTPPREAVLVQAVRQAHSCRGRCHPRIFSDAVQSRNGGAGRPMSGGTTRYHARRKVARRPVAPRQPRPPAPPSGDDVFNWRANETVLGPTPKRGSSVMARIRALYAPSEPDGGAE
jgi:hypothetical protein